MLLSHSALYFFKGRTRPDSASPEAQNSTSSHYDQVFGLTQIPQVIMNIDYKLEPIADKNVAAYFHDLGFSSDAKLLYHFKNYQLYSKSLHLPALLKGLSHCITFKLKET